MKKIFLLFCALAFLCLSGAAVAGAAQYDLNFTTTYFDRHPTVVKVFRPWMQEVNDKTQGRLKITYFTPNTICPEAEVLDSVATGGVDMAGSTVTRNAGRILVGELGQMPLISRHPRSTAMAWYDVMTKYPQHFPEFQKDITLLCTWASALTEINTTKKPVRKLEDLKGLKIIGWNPVSLDIIRHLGAIPMMQSNADTYLALERGMADGVLCPLAPLRSQKLTDILRYHTMCDLHITPFWGGINTKTFQALPPDIRKVLVESTGLEFSGIVGQSLEDATDEDLEWIRKEGKAEIITLSDAELARWGKATEPMVEATIKKLSASGFKEADMRELFDYYTKRIAFYNQSHPGK